MTEAKKTIIHTFEELIASSIKTFVIIPIIVYYIGFLFAQGFFSPMTKHNVLNLFGESFVQLSYFNIIANGINHVVVVSAIVILGGLLYVVIDELFIQNAYPKLSDWHKTFQIKVFKYHINKYDVLIAIPLSFVILTVILALYSQLILLEYGIKLGNWWIAIEAVMPFIYFLTIKIIKWYSRINSNNALSENVRFSEIMYFTYLWIILWTASFLIFTNGVIAKNKQIADYKENKGTYSLSVVYTEDFAPRSYIEMDLSDASFIGFDRTQSKVVIIPRDKIKKIESYKLKLSEVYTLEGHDYDLLNNDEKEVVNLIKSYYLYSTKEETFDPEKVVELLSPKCRRDQYGSATTESLKILWTQGQNYYGDDIKNLLATDFSKPKIIENNKFKITVVELWKEYKTITVFVVKKENNQYKIDSIKNGVDFMQYR